MKDLRIEKLANNLLNHSINLQKGEKILIEIIGTEAIPLGKELIRQAEKIGALPFFNIIDYEILFFVPLCSGGCGVMFFRSGIYQRDRSLPGMSG